MFIAELSILASFVCFLILAWRKVVPSLTAALDAYSQNVQTKLSEASTLKAEAEKMLDEAKLKESRINEQVQQLEEKSKDRIHLLENENKEYLESLKKKFELAMQSRIEKEILRKKEELVGQLTDLIVQKLADQHDRIRIRTEIKESELKKLV